MKGKEAVELKSGKRQSNFEVLRIVSALLIILFHCSYCSGYGAWLISGFDGNHVVSILLQSWGLVGVHCFFFVSAYFLADSGTIKAHRAVELVAETVFYILLMYGVSVLFGTDKSYSVFGAVKEMLAFILDEYWFVGAYLTFYLLVPYLHAAAVNLKPNMVLRLIVILLVLMSFMKTFSDIRLFGNAALPILDYFIIVYLKKTEKGRLNVFLQKHAGKTALLLIAFQCAYNIGFLWLSDRTGSKYAGELGTKLMGRFSFTQIAIALCLFICFSRLKIGYHKIINRAASASLAVYLIHANPTFQITLWDRILRIPEAQTKSWYVLWILACAVMIWAIGVAVDLVRQAVFGLVKNLGRGYNK